MLRIFFTTLLIAIFSFGCIGAEAHKGSNLSTFDIQRCVNMGNSFEAPIDGSWGKALDISDFAKIKAKGFDTVRIPVRWSDYTGPGPEYKIDPIFMSKVDAAVTEALSQNLNVILNIHHFEEIMEDPTGELKHLVAMWRQIAPRFSNRSDDLWFETLNEPNNKLSGKLMQAAQTAAVMAIRESNPDRIIILGGDDWSGIDSLVTNIMPPDDNIVYTFHYYDPFEFTHQKAPWVTNGPKKKRDWGSSKDKKQLANAVVTATDFRDFVGRPVFVGEFGAYEVIENDERVEYVGDVRVAMEAADIPWCLWAFSNTFPIYDSETQKWDEDMLEALGMNELGQAAPKLTTRVVSAANADVADENWGKFLSYYTGTSDYAEDILTGVAVIKPGQEIHPPHKHAEEEFLMVIEGNGTWTIEDRDFPAKAGDILFSKPWELHGLKNTGTTPLRFVVFKYNRNSH